VGVAPEVVVVSGAAGAAVDLAALGMFFWVCGGWMKMVIRRLVRSGDHRKSLNLKAPMAFRWVR